MGGKQAAFFLEFLGQSLLKNVSLKEKEMENLSTPFSVANKFLFSVQNK